MAARYRIHFKHALQRVPGYDLLPKLRELRIPTLVIVGGKDFIPPAIAQ